MKNKLLEKFYLIQISIISLILISGIIYLKSPADKENVYQITKETIDKVLLEISLYDDNKIDYLTGFKNAFYNSLPFTQIVEYKKTSLIYNLALVSNSKRTSLSKEEINVLFHHKKLFDLIDIIGNTKINMLYIFYQFLGVLAVFSILYSIYFILKKLNKSDLIRSYFIILVFLYFINFVFLGLIHQKDKVIESKLKEITIN